MTDDLKAELKKANKTDNQIDLSDMPEVADWSGVQRGLFRPLKKPIKMRVDADVLAWFQAQGRMYQRRMNAALREYIRLHSKKKSA